ncbi:Phospholipase D1 [Blastocladiella emersonii ATCC 22665]|nr:Phospholipase D1 [Blastocladiella emersonii ATCC 22665]
MGGVSASAPPSDKPAAPTQTTPSTSTSLLLSQSPPPASALGLTGPQPPPPYSESSDDASVSCILMSPPPQAQTGAGVPLQLRRDRTESHELTPSSSLPLSPATSRDALNVPGDRHVNFYGTAGSGARDPNASAAAAAASSSSQPQSTSAAGTRTSVNRPWASRIPKFWSESSDAVVGAPATTNAESDTDDYAPGSSTTGATTPAATDVPESPSAQKRLSAWVEQLLHHRVARKQNAQRGREAAFAFFPLLGSALKVPFVGFTAEIPPVILEAFQFHVEEVDDRVEHRLPSLHAITFAITCCYGPYAWTVYRDEGDFLQLRSMAAFKNVISRRPVHLPNFPGWIDWHAPQAFGGNPQTPTTPAARAAAIKAYLGDLLRALNLTPELRRLCEFLNFSCLSFDRHFPNKPLEMYVTVHSPRPRRFLGACLGPTTHRAKHWLMVGPTWLVLLNDIDDPLPEEVVLLDGAHLVVEEFKSRVGVLRQPLIRITYGVGAGEEQFREFRAESAREHEDLLLTLRDMAAHQAHLAPHPYHGFAPVHRGTQVEFFVDGEAYFDRLAAAIEAATRCIYIADWWLTPELYLRRPLNAGAEAWRLDKLLQRKAREGVDVYVLVYKEVAAALANNSFHTKFALLGLHPNVHVQRDPDVLGNGLNPWWAHHEKCVIVDEAVTFMGGLDICLGRWDTNAHRLADPHPLGSGRQVFPGQDYSNPRVLDFRAVDSAWATDIIDRTSVPRMPWHDVACVVVGNPDPARHFVQRWNYTKRRKPASHGVVPMLLPPGVANAGMSPAQLAAISGVDAALLDFGGGRHDTQLTRSVSPWSAGVQTESSIYEAYLALIANAKHFIYIENQFFDAPARNRIGQALYTRIKQAHERREPFRVIVVMPLLPAFPGPIDSSAASTLRLVMNYQYESISRGPDSLLARLAAAGVPHEKYIKFYGLRAWDEIVASPEAIEAAARPRATSRASRMSRAVSERQSVRSLRGRTTSFNAAAPVPTNPQGSMPALDRASAVGSASSIISPADQQVAAGVPPPTLLRVDGTNGGPGSSSPSPTPDSGEPAGVLCTEMVYIHTKLMIVDDSFLVLGSANINDRSMLGDRDSELALVVSGAGDVPVRFGDTEVRADRAIHGLRMKLFKEHVGCLESSGHDAALANVLAPEFNAAWEQTAARNTRVFRDVFHCVPDDTVETWTEYSKFTTAVPLHDMPHADTKAALGGVQGHLVEFPTKFLQQENLGASLLSAENFVPPEIFA